MLGDKGSKLLVIGWCAFVGAFIFVAYTDFAIVLNSKWCGNADQHCLRDWIASLSGWAAAIGALIAAWVTLPELRRQANESRRQTDYMVGDAEPDFVLMRGKRGLRLEAINWNRRNVVIENWTPIDVDRFEILSVFPVDEDQGVKEKERIPSYRLNGWKNRDNPAPIRKFQVILGKNGQPFEDNNASDIGVTIELTFRIVGQVHERRSTKVQAMKKIR